MPVSPGSSRPSRRSPWRLRILVGAIVSAIAGAAMAGWLIARTSTPPSGPVILISVDSLRADHLGAYGYPRGRTPNIDALAAAGVVFERAFSHSPLTVPAHATVLSGRLPFETGVRDDEGAKIAAKPPLLPALLHRRGFKTAGVVSSGLLARHTGLATAFDFFDDELPRRSPATPAGSVHRDAAASVEVAKRWVEQQGNRFFLFLHLEEPRAPHVAPARFAGQAPYDAEIRAVDEQIGAFVEFLKARDLYDRAVILVTSGHGDPLGEHGEKEPGLFLYGATQHVPLIVKMPKDEGAGRRRSEVVQHIDIAPTVLDLMGAPRPSSLRGRSLRQLLDSEEARLAPAPVYAESLAPRTRFGWSPLTSVTDGRYRYIRSPRPELYDLLQDRAEQTNLAAANPAKLAELSAALDRQLAAAPAAASSVLTPEDRLLVTGATPAAAEPVPAGSTTERASHGTATAPKVGSPEAQAAETGTTVANEAAATPVLADPKDRLAVYDRVRAANTLAAEMHMVEAVAAYRQLTAEDPGMPDVWRRLGEALLATGEASEGLEAFRAATRLAPENAAAILGAANALVKLGHLAEAERHAAVAVKLDAEAGTELLVSIALRRADMARARQAAEQLAEADEATPMTALVYGVELCQGGKYQEAVPRLEEAVRLAGARPVQTPEVLAYLGEALLRLGKHGDAEARFTDELKWFPESVRAREGLASVYLATGRTSQVPPLVTDLVRSAPTPEGYAAAARISTLTGDKAGAAALRAESRKRFGEDPQPAAAGGEPRH